MTSPRDRELLALWEQAVVEPPGRRPLALLTGSLTSDDTVGRVGLVRLRYSAVESSGARFLGIDVRDREKLYARVRHPKALRLNGDAFRYPVQIPEITLDRKVEDLARLIEQYRDDRLARETLGEFDAPE